MRARKVISMNNCIIENGQKTRIGPVYKTEISDALGLTQHYAWHYLIHRNQFVMNKLLSMGYRKDSQTVSRSIARFLAKHFDIYIEGINEEDKLMNDESSAISDSKK